jgi:hypothetical protein
MPSKRQAVFLLFAAGALFSSVFLGPASGGAQTPRRPARETLIADVDLTCSFILVETPAAFRVGPPATDDQKTVFSDFDQFYSVGTPAEEMSPGRVWTILEYGPSVRLGERKDIRGTIAFRRGRARFLRMDGTRAKFQIEKACGPVMAGYGLVPFMEPATLRGEQQAWDVPFGEGGTSAGRVVFLDDDLVQLGTGQWAIVDLGGEDGLAVGQQLALFHQAGEVPPQAVGNAVVISLGPRWATVKILSAKDTIRLGDLVLLPR